MVRSVEGRACGREGFHGRKPGPSAAQLFPHLDNCPFPAHSHCTGQPPCRLIQVSTSYIRLQHTCCRPPHALHTSTPVSHHNTCPIDVRMKEVSASQGLMLESISSRLMGPGQLHLLPSLHLSTFSQAEPKLAQAGSARSTPVSHLHTCFTPSYLFVLCRDEGSECKPEANARVHFKSSHGARSAQPSLHLPCTFLSPHRMKEVSASQGLMLESISSRLMEPGQAHHNCPDKEPALRLATIEAAGQAQVPFTTGGLDAPPVTSILGACLRARGSGSELSPYVHCPDKELTL